MTKLSFVDNRYLELCRRNLNPKHAQEHRAVAIRSCELMLRFWLLCILEDIKWTSTSMGKSLRCACQGRAFNKLKMIYYMGRKKCVDLSPILPILLYILDIEDIRWINMRILEYESFGNDLWNFEFWPWKILHMIQS